MHKYYCVFVIIRCINRATSRLKVTNKLFVHSFQDLSIKSSFRIQDFPDDWFSHCIDYSITNISLFLSFHLCKIKHYTELLKTNRISFSQFAQKYQVFMSKQRFKLPISHSPTYIKLQERLQFKHFQFPIKAILTICSHFKMRTKGEDCILYLFNNLCMKVICIVMGIAALNFNYSKKNLFLCWIDFHDKIICPFFVFIIQVCKQLLMKVNRNKEGFLCNTLFL